MEMGFGVSNIRKCEESLAGADSEYEALPTETNIMDLPDDCLLQILRCLGPVDINGEILDLRVDEVAVRNSLHCALVCKRLRSLCDLAVDSLRLVSDVDIPQLLKAFARWRCLRRLDLGSCLKTNGLKTVLQSASSILPFLQNLRLEHEWSDGQPDICIQAYSLPHLTALELSCNQLPPLNDRSSRILHTLELLVDSETELPESLGLFTRLKRLSIEAHHLVSLPTSIGRLSLLTRLDLISCESLTDLPGSIEDLTGLRYLRVQACCNLRDCPQSLWDLRALRTFIWTLNSENSRRIDVHHLTRLKDLRLATINSFEGLPENVGDLQHLTELELFDGGRSFSELPSSFVTLSNLQNLTSWCCLSLLHLPEDIGSMVSLRKLDLLGLPSLVTLPESLTECNSLTVVKIWDCDSLQNLPQGLGRLSLLEEISIGNCPSLTSLPSSLGHLPMLRSLTVDTCGLLRELPGTLRGLTMLETLSIERCPSLVSLPQGLGALGKLQNLCIHGCPIREISEEIGNLSTLQIMSILDCHNLLCLPPCPALRSLEIFRKFPEISGEQAPALEELRLHSLVAVSLPPSIGSFESLKSLCVEACVSLTGLPKSLGQLKALERLELLYCSSLASLPESVGSLDKLTELRICSCPLKELPESISQLTSLQALNLRRCALVSLPQSLGALSNLRKLVLGQWYPVTHVPDNIRNLGGGKVFITESDIDVFF